MSFEPTEWRSDNACRYEAKLPGGQFTLMMSREDLPFREACDLAIRNNAKRRFLFVSRVLGRHIPVRPATLIAVAASLAEKLQSSLKVGPVVFIGMAETATTLGQAVFREFLELGGNGLYIESTRRSTGGEQAFSFSESHSHATAHVIHLPSSEDDPQNLLRTARQVVVVDDEATTARTAANLVIAMKDWRGENGAPFDACLAVILRWKQGGIDDDAFAGVESLVEGTFEFHPDSNLPAAPVAIERIDLQRIAPRGIRHGNIVPQTMPAQWNISARPDERILIVGNGEYGFQPFLLASALETKGALAWVMATTRSPILPGGAIGHVRSFDALSGEGHAEFLYNVPDDHGYDRVILCLEDPAPIGDHPILRIPRLEVWT